jgi:hypothetical protein
VRTKGPSRTELADIEAEWPVIAAELAVVAAECRLAASPDALAVRAHRRAVSRLARIARAASTRRARPTASALAQSTSA